MTNHLPVNHRLIGAIVGGWLALEVATFFGLLFPFLAVPFVAVLGATSYGQRLARPALALTGGIMASSVASATAGLLGFAGPVLALPALVAATAALWLMATSQQPSTGEANQNPVQV